MKHNFRIGLFGDLIGAALLLAIMIAAGRVGAQANQVAVANAAQLPVQAAPITTYTVSWYTIDDGGGSSSGGNYLLGGTLGQPDAASLSGGSYTLVGGFWGGGAIVPAAGNYQLFLPLMFR